MCHRLHVTARRARIDAAEDIKGMGTDCVIMAVVRDAFKDITLCALEFAMSSDPVLVGIRGMFCGADAWGDGILLQGSVNGRGGLMAYGEHSALAG